MSTTVLNNRFDIDEAANLVTEFKSTIKFPKTNPPEGIEDLLENLSSNDYIKLLDKQDISSFMLTLTLYSTYLTTQEARYKSFINFCESNIKAIVGENLGSITGYFAEKDLIIRSTNMNAKEFETKKLSAQLKLDTIQYLSSKLDKLCDVLKIFYYEKKGSYDSNYKT